MIILGATVFDLDGYIVIHDSEIDPNSGIDNGNRRVSRTATLDGGVGVVDTGFTHSDRTLDITLPDPSRELYDSIVHLAQLYPEIIISIDEGAFIGVIENYATINGKFEVTLLIYRSA